MTTEASLCKIERALAAVEAENARLVAENARLQHAHQKEVNNHSQTKRDRDWCRKAVEESDRAREGIRTNWRDDSKQYRDENAAYMGTLTCALDWLVNKPDDMSEASVIAMIRAELGIKAEVQS